jgi:hypothetical protein
MSTEYKTQGFVAQAEIELINIGMDKPKRLLQQECLAEVTTRQEPAEIAR